MSPRLPSAITSSPAARAWATTAPSTARPGSPSASKRASCGLTATQAGAAASISARQCASTAAAAALARRKLAVGRLRGGPQRSWIGIDAEDELGLALGHPRGQRVAEAQGPLSAPSRRS